VDNDNATSIVTDGGPPATEPSSRTARAGDVTDARAAERCEQRGRERAALLDAARALDAFAEAESRWSDLGATDGVCRAWVHAATLHLRGLGDLHGAALWLEQARRARGPRGSDAWARATLARADLLFLRGNPARAAAVVDVVTRTLEDANGPPSALIGTAIQGIAVTRGSAQDRFARLLATQLERVMPPAARLVLLDRLDVCPPLSGSPELRTRLRRLIPSPVSAPHGYPAAERARLAFRDAELDRVLGRGEDAVLKLEHAWRKLGPESAHALAAAAVRANARRLAIPLAEAMLARSEVGRSVMALAAPYELASEGGAGAPADGVALVQLAGVLDDAGLRARALGAAERLLDDRQAGAWPARLFELRAREAATAELSLEYRRRAAGIYEAMGDDVRRDRALGRSPSRGSLPAVPAAAHELCVTVRMRGGRLTLIARDHAGRVGVVRDAMAPAASGRDLAKLLRDAVTTVSGDHGSDVGLLARHPVAGALPWELAAPALEAAGLRLFRLARRTQGDEIDARGALSRCRATSLSRFQAVNGLPATGLPDPVTVQRLHQAVTGEDAPRVAIVGDDPATGAAYTRAGFHPLVVRDGLASLLHDQPVAVLHIHAHLTDHHGTPALDLPTPLTAIALDRKLPRDLPAPLVVLDARKAELALRNVFATHLSAAGTIRAILATSQGEAVATALRHGTDIYDVTRAIRALDPEAALFARTPSIRFPMPAAVRGSP
jgi:hypothetical protein